MSIKSINSILLYASNLSKSHEFYKKLGFITNKNVDFVEAVLDDFILTLFDQNKVHFKEEAKIKPKGAGLFIMIKTDGVDEYYKTIKEMGLKPSSKPKDWPWGNREFAIKDPDGYKLVFFERT